MMWVLVCGIGFICLMIGAGIGWSCGFADGVARERQISGHDWRRP